MVVLLLPTARFIWKWEGKVMLEIFFVVGVLSYSIALHMVTSAWILLLLYTLSVLVLVSSYILALLLQW